MNKLNRLTRVLQNAIHSLFFSAAILFLGFHSASLFALAPIQPQPQLPSGGQVSQVPQFSAAPSSLQAGVSYVVAVSASPRSGSNDQYVDFWVKGGLSSADLLSSNLNRLSWGAGWEQKTRYGNPDGGATTVSYSSPSSLAPGQTYYWHIVATNADGLSKSYESSFTIAAPPNQPSLLITNDLNRAVFQLSWGAAQNVTSYNLYHNGALIYSGLLLKMDVNVSNYATNNQFILKACNQAGCSSGQQVVGNFPTPPKTPIIIGPVVGGYSVSIPTFSASPNSLVADASYVIALSESPRGGLKNQYNNYWSQQGFSTNDLLEANLARKGWDSTWVQRTRNGNPDGESAVVANSSPATLTIGKTYYWHIVATTENGGLSKSAEGKFTVVPQKSTVSIVPELNRNIFDVSWQPVADATSYELYHNGQKIYTGINVNYEVAVVTPGQSNSFYVKACYQTYCSSSETQLSVFPVPPPVPVLFTPALNGTASTTPNFSAVAASLSESASYIVAISESPRGGLKNQYNNYWSQQGFSANDLLEANLARKGWDSTWVQRTRNGNPDGESAVVANNSPATLTIGKTYYWHIVATTENGGLSKSAEGTFTVVGNATTVSSVYEAELALIYKGSIKSEHAGFSGTGFVDYDSVVGSYVEWTINVAAAGTAILDFRYANGDAITAGRPMDILVNGVSRGILNFTGKGNWAIWANDTLSVTLVAGVNKIRAVATIGKGGPNVDYLRVSRMASAQSSRQSSSSASIAARRIIFIHTDALGSPAAETNQEGNENE